MSPYRKSQLKAERDSAEEVVRAQVGSELDLPRMERCPDVGIPILGEEADAPREFPRYTASHFQAMGRARVEALEMLDVEPRSDRQVRLEPAMREVRAHEHRPPEHQIEGNRGDGEIDLPESHGPCAGDVDWGLEQDPPGVGDRPLSDLGLSADVGSKIGHVQAEPEELGGLEPMPNAAAHQERFIEADIRDQAGRGHAIKLPVEGKMMALGDIHAAVQVGEPLCGG